jgi:transcriptional regulator with XRE-family HTH domain
LPKPVPSLFQRLLQHLPGQRRTVRTVVEERRQDPLLQAGQQLREARESRGIGLRQLALDTRISTSVLEALERGWRDRLPEAAYLRTMLPLLEHHLELPGGCLDGVLPPEQDPRSGRRRDTVLLRFTPGSIDVFTTWQGTVLYAVLCGGLLYGLNLQQRQLAAQGLNALRPIPPLSAAQAAQANLEDADRAILGAYPDLRPLGKAAAGQGLQRLRWETSQNRPDLALGLLRLELARPTRVSLRSDRGVETQLPTVQGSLNLPVLPPFSLRLEPAPAVGSVRWNGQPLAPATAAGQSLDPTSGQGQAQFLYPPPAAASRPRP